MRRHLDPNAPATDECITGRVRDERASAPTVHLTGEQADDLTAAAMRDELIAALGESCEQLERDANRLMPGAHGRTLAALAARHREVLAKAERSRA